MNENTDAARCPECGAALDTGARKNAAKRAVQFISDAKKMRRDREFRGAASLYSCAIELATEAARPDIRAEAYWGRGDCYGNLGDNGIALLDYKDAHKFAPDEDLYLSCLVKLRESGRIKKPGSRTESEIQEEEVNRMSKHTDENGVTRCPECGAALDTGARESLAKRAEQFIKDAQNVMSNYHAAIPLYSCALELAAEAALPRLRAEALWRRGVCYERLEMPDRALFDYEDAHRFDPGNDDYLKSMAELRSDLDHEKRLKSKKRGKK